ncbi:MAG: secretion system protein [Pirellulaceae bacterium]|nr:MAG: secretion system protein [Pirellulaceae bacterium]
MTTFSYLARNRLGQTRRGRLEAPNRDSLVALLRKEGWQLVECQSAAPRRFGRRISKAEIAYMTTELAVLVDTGISLAAALATLADQADNPALAQLLHTLRADVEGGQDFSAALAQHPRYFSPTYVSLIKASEKTGTLGEMLEQLAQHMSSELENRRKVLAAMAYPAVMLGLAVVVTIFLLTYVMPKFQPLFDRQGSRLPRMTLVMLGVSQSLIHYWWAWLVTAAAAILGLWYSRRIPAGRRVWDRLLIDAPVVGSLTRKVVLSRSLRTLALMVRSGVPILDGLKLAAEVAGNVYFRQLWLHVADNVMQGNRICDALRQSPLVPKMLVQMIASAEETGKLDYVLRRICQHYDREVDLAIKTTTSLVEPILITVMGVVVGGIAMALLLPIFSLSRPGH